MDTSEIEITDFRGMTQPNAEERAEAVAIAQSDPKLASFFEDSSIRVSGGFLRRSEFDDDPCSREVCVLVQLHKGRADINFRKFVVVNLTQQKVVHYDFQANSRGGRGDRLSVLDGGAE